jgi:hypothetical protein
LRSNPELAAAADEQIYRVWGDGFEQIATQAVARGEIAPRAPDSLALLAWIGPSVALLRFFSADERVDRGYWVQVVDEVLVPALRSA